MPSQPLVSIGVPVYNDAPWLPNALDHLLKQDHQNLEIILADDGSTDSSREICHEYASRDKRIRYFENKHNLGGWRNHKFVFDLSQGDYFAWGSGHDYYMPSFVSHMLEQLNSNPSVILCCPKSLYFYNEKPWIPPELLDTRGAPPVERIKRLVAFRAAGGTADAFYGLYRSEFLSKVDISRGSVNWDAIMLAELCFLGEILQTDEVLLKKVLTRGNWNVRASRESFREHLDKLKLSKGSVEKEYLPRLNSFIEYMKMVENADASLDQKEYLYKVIKGDTVRYAPIILDEVGNFIRYFSEEMRVLETYPRLRRYYAFRILSALRQAQILGFECDGLHELRSTCLSALGLKLESSIVKLKGARLGFRNTVRKMFHQCRLNVANFRHNLIGDKTWQRLKRIVFRR